MARTTSAPRSARPGRPPLQVAAVTCAAVLGSSSCTTSAVAPTEPPAESRVASPSCEPPGSPVPTSTNDRLPALRLPCLGGGPDVDPDTVTGRPTLVNLRASWCAPCREEMPRLARALREPVDSDGTLLSRLGYPGLPVTVGLDPAGRIVATHVGPMDDAALVHFLDHLYGTDPSAAGPSG